jgi:carbohydrate-binding DOMON domain-containing protein
VQFQNQVPDTVPEGFPMQILGEVPENFRRITVQIFDGFGVDTWKVSEVSGADTL